MKKYLSSLIILLLLVTQTAYTGVANKSKQKSVESNIENSVITIDGTEYFILPNGTMVEAGIPEDVVDMIFKRVEAIENGDLSAFRSTLGEMQDGVDYYYQLGIIFKFFGDFFDIDSDTFDDAVANGSEELPKIAETLFCSEHPLRSRNTGLSIKKLEIKSGSGLVVILTNNKNEEIIYNFLYY